MAEWSIAAVLKTVELRGSGGSNPSLSAKVLQIERFVGLFFDMYVVEARFFEGDGGAVDKWLSGKILGGSFSFVNHFR